MCRDVLHVPFAVSCFVCWLILCARAIRLPNPAKNDYFFQIKPLARMTIRITQDELVNQIISMVIRKTVSFLPLAVFRFPLSSTHYSELHHFPKAIHRRHERLAF